MDRESHPTQIHRCRTGTDSSSAEVFWTDPVIHVFNLVEKDKEGVTPVNEQSVTTVKFDVDQPCQNTCDENSDQVTQRISNKECISLILRQIKKIEDSQLTLLSLNDSGDSARQVEHQCEYRDTKNLFELRESFLDKMIKAFKDRGEMDHQEVIDV